MIYLIKDLYQFLKKETLICILLSFFCLQINGLIATYMLLFLVPLMFYKTYNKGYIDLLFLLIVFYSFSYSSFAFLNGFFDKVKGNFVFISIYPPLFYIIGRYLVNKYVELLYCIIFMMVGFISFTTIRDVFGDIINNQFINTSRILDDDNPKAATLLGVFVSLIVSCIGLIFSMAKAGIEKAYKKVFITLSFLGIVCVLHLVNRTGLVLAFISLFISFFVNVKKINYFIIVLGFLSFVVLYEESSLLKFDKLEAAYEERDQGVGTIKTGGGRTDLWKKGISDLYDKPLGYNNDDERNIYAHNFWLDTSAVAGIIPFFLLLIVTVTHLINVGRILKFNKKNYTFLQNIIITCNIGFIVTCMVEPILEASLVYVFLFFMFMGICKEISKSTWV